jgi:hypothetical protein
MTACAHSRERCEVLEGIGFIVRARSTLGDGTNRHTFVLGEEYRDRQHHSITIANLEGTGTAAGESRSVLIISLVAL